MSTLVSFLALANLIFIPCLLYLQEEPTCRQHLSGPTKIMPKSLYVAALQGVKMELEFIQKGREALLPQRGATLWPSALQGFHNCGQGLLKYLNNC